MRVLHLIFLLLWEGRYGLIREEPSMFTFGAGRTIRMSLFFDSYGDRKIFCRFPCENSEDILVDTLSNFHRNGRYSIALEPSTQYHKLQVTIEDVTTSDSGLYFCGMESYAENFREHLNFREIILQINKDSEGKTTVHPAHSSLLWLLLVPVVMVIASVLLFLIWKKKKTQKRRTTQNKNVPVNVKEDKTESAMYDDVGPVLDHPDAIYQDLSLDTIDPDYSVIDNYIIVE